MDCRCAIRAVRADMSLSGTIPVGRTGLAYRAATRAASAPAAPGGQGRAHRDLAGCRGGGIAPAVPPRAVAGYCCGHHAAGHERVRGRRDRGITANGSTGTVSYQWLLRPQSQGPQPVSTLQLMGPGTGTASGPLACLRHWSRAGDGNRTRMTSLEGWWHILDGPSGLRLVTSRYAISIPLRACLGRNLGRNRGRLKSVEAGAA
jgi:hypothetical protein